MARITTESSATSADALLTSALGLARSRPEELSAAGSVRVDLEVPAPLGSRGDPHIWVGWYPHPPLRWNH